jgi:hypothetical protein
MENPFKYPAAGRCIYCGEVKPALTDEHIIPESLGGLLELPDASCSKCQKEINKFEHPIGKRMFGDLRVKRGFPTKRKKERLADLEKGVTVIQTDVFGVEHRIQVPHAEHPTPVFMYKMGTANSLLGLPYGTNIFDWIPYVNVNDAEMSSFHQKHPSARWKVRMIPHHFARMLAKIAYSFVVAELGYGSFEPAPHLLDIILGRSEDVAYLIGSNMEIEADVVPHLHTLHVRLLQPKPHVFITMLVEIRLFAQMPSPLYHVLVGHFDSQNPQHVIALDKKTRDYTPKEAL